MQLCNSLSSFYAKTNLKKKELLIIQSFSFKISCLITYSLLSFYKLNSISYIFICNSYSVFFNKSYIIKFTSSRICLIFLCNFNFYYNFIILYNIILMSISLLWEDLYLIKKLQLTWLRYYTLQIIYIALNFLDSSLRRNDYKLINLNNCTAWFKLILIIYKFINNKNTAFM